MRRLAIVLFIAVFISSVATLSHATQVVYKTPKQLGQESALVVQGKVGDVRSFWNAKRTKIFTETRIDIDQSYKGNASASVTLLQLGGVVDNVQVNVHGAVQWQAGEEVLLFLEPYINGTFHVSGFSQGKYRVERDPDTGEPFVQAAVSEDVQLVGAPGVRPTAAPKAGLMPLTQFVNHALGRK